MLRRFAQKTLTRMPVQALIILLTALAVLLPAGVAAGVLNRQAKTLVYNNYAQSLAIAVDHVGPARAKNVQGVYEELEADLAQVLGRYACTMYVDYAGAQYSRSYNLQGSGLNPFPLSAEDMAEVGEAEQGILLKNSMNRGRLLLLYSQVDPDTQLYLVLPTAQFSGDSSRLLAVVGGMFLAVLALLFCANLVFRAVISRPVKKLLFSMRNPALPLDLAPYDQWRNEMGQLSVAYGQRVKTNLENLAQVNSFNDRKREFEIEALQNQINSHFIYNTLNNIQWLALAGRTDDVIATAKSLDNLLRACSHNENEMVTIEEELGYVESYLSAQKIRFGDVFDYEFDLDTLVMQMKIPKFILQPIVENSIYHGFLECNRKNGMIRISVKRRGHRIDIRVADNGIGIENQRLQTVLRNEYKSSGRFMGVALGNVNKRIKLLCGKEFGLGIHSKYGEYTVTEIVIPIIV